MVDAEQYQLDENLGVYLRKGSAEIEYCDGEGIESSLLGILRKTKDVSTSSDELRASMSDWPSEYHFSRKRHLVLKPFGIEQGQRVLELGCGCGALTRYLGECGAEVVAVEGTAARAAVAAERTRDLPNVRVYVDDLQDIGSLGEFDWVLLIGVVEYAPRFSEGPRPVEAYLHVARDHLVEGGSLILAIENRLGLKYFNSAKEDHLGRHFYGLEDLYGPREPTTWGRVELAAHLEGAGFRQREFFGAFPDYKLPEVIFSEDAAAHPRLDLGEMLFSVKSHDYGGWDYRFFDEGLVARSLGKNGLLLDLANSFVVRAQTGEGDHRLSTGSTLAYHFNTVRLPAFCTQTVFADSPRGVEVLKQPLFRDRPMPREINLSEVCGYDVLMSMALSETPEPYVTGEIAAVSIARHERRRDLTALDQCWSLWMRNILRTRKLYRRRDGRFETVSIDDRTEIEELFIDSAAFDLGPKNVKALESDPVSFDFEWSFSAPLPLGWILFRALLQARRSSFETGSKGAVDVALAAISRELGRKVSWRELREWRDAEEFLQQQISQPEPCSSRKLRAMSLDKPRSASRFRQFRKRRRSRS